MTATGINALIASSVFGILKKHWKVKKIKKFILSFISILFVVSLSACGTRMDGKDLNSTEVVSSTKEEEMETQSLDQMEEALPTEVEESEKKPVADGKKEVASEENLSKTTPEPDAFYITPITDDIFTKMQGRSYKADCTIDREELRYVHILHTGFDGETKEGELVVNKAIADDVLAIFEELYRAKYPIEKVRLVDEYGADDEASMSDNNSSAFNFRTISHTTTISKHGLGMAIDINPLYNPYVKTVNGALSIEPTNAAAYVDRSEENPYRIDHDDLCYKLFTEHGFTWGGDWVHSKDYQHFEKELN